MCHNRWTIATMVVVLSCAANAALAQGEAKTKTALETKAAGPKTFYVDDQAGSNQVSFASQAPIEDFTGVCNKVHGECRVDPKELETFTGRFAVRVEDMRTGIDLRDTHMRSEDWLDAAKYPEVVIEIKSVADVKKTQANAATLTLVGTCTFHGKSNPVRIPATLTYLDESPKTQEKVKGDLVRVRGEFKAKLSDYGVTGPKGSDLIGLKVADDIEIKATIFGSTEPPPKKLEADKPLPTTQPVAPAPPPPKRP